MEGLAGRYLATNTPILDSEARTLRTCLSETETELANLNVTISARNASDELLHQHMELTAKIAAYKIAIAPHKKLAPELLIKIFRHCIPGPISLPQRLHAFPLLLCQVCSAWRTVALGSPMLWNAIEVDFGKVQGDRQVVELLEVAKTYISRSGLSTPLSIQIHIDCNAHGLFQRTDLNPVEDLIIPHINRFRKINLVACPDFFEPLLVLPRGSTKLLEDFSLETLGDSESSNIVWSAGLGRGHQFNLPFTGTSTSSIFAGLRLTDLRLMNHPSPHICHAVLRQCTNLVNCSIDIGSLACSNFNQILPDLPPILLPNVRQFHFRARGTSEYAPFFHPLVLPALKDFKFESSRDTCWINSSFISLLSRSSFDLKTFTVMAVMISGDDIESLLEHMPSLVMLRLPYSAQLRQSTMDRISSGDLIPRLEDIKFNGRSITAAVNMIQSRYLDLDDNHAMTVNSRGIPVSTLRNALLTGINLGKPLDPGVSRLLLLKKAGLRIHYSYRGW